MKILVTCPPMIRSISHVQHRFTEAGVEFYCPQVTQTLSVEELVELVPQYDGWIIGDDPANRTVFEAGLKGQLKAMVKWGVGVDNVDLVSARELQIPITNTPGMFGREVADVALTYLLGLARETYTIDREVKKGGWPKPAGISLDGKKVALVGFGDIGRNTAKRLLAFDMDIRVYDPYFKPAPGIEPVTPLTWPERIEEADFIVLTCALVPSTQGIINAELLKKAKPGVRIVNVSRGPLIDEPALEDALASGHVRSAALEVFATEPLPADSKLRNFEQCIFGSHNGSNTIEAVTRTSHHAIDLLFGYLGITSGGAAKS